VISIPSLIECGVSPTQARIFAAPLAAATDRFDIESPEQVAAFLAQAQHESTNLTRLEENCYYSKVDFIWAAFKRLRNMGRPALELLTRRPQALANVAYAFINGNGSVSSGDGWRYRGRGIFQLTGRANYRAAAKALGPDFEAHPELAAEPVNAALIAGWFWDSRMCNELMAAGDFEAVSTRINGASPANGATERRKLYHHNLTVFRT
jgi:putative chitinase